MEYLADFLELNESIRTSVGKYGKVEASRRLRLYHATIRKHLKIPHEILRLGYTPNISRPALQPLITYLYVTAEEITEMATDLERGYCLTQLKPRLGLPKHSPFFVVHGLKYFLDSIDYEFDDVSGFRGKYSIAQLEAMLHDIDTGRKTRNDLMRELGVGNSRITQLLRQAAHNRRGLEHFKLYGMRPHTDVFVGVR